MASEAIFHAPSGSVQFAIYPDGYDGARILARIDEEALHTRFQALGDRDCELLQAYTRHSESIDEVATERYRRDPTHAIWLGCQDFQG